jgi:hypothetical protein
MRGPSNGKSMAARSKKLAAIGKQLARIVTI